MEMYSAAVDMKLEQGLIYGFVQPIYINLIQRFHKSIVLCMVMSII